jgi:predicted  nucleic acid-binding Zn-ribbon protein
MENTEVTQEVVSTESSPAPEAAPAQPTQTEAPAQAAAAGTEAATPPAWTPNYKVKSYDNEYEIPEDFRSYINQENEKKFREVFERHFAFDTIKQKYKDAHTKYQEVNGKYDTVSKNLDKLSKYVQNGDFDSFFSTIKIPEGEIQKWIYNKLQVKDLPQEQQQLYTKNSEYQRQLMEREERMSEMENKLAEFESYKQEQAIQKRHSELDSAINNGEYKQIAESYDARVGKPGAFKQEVILRAAAVANATGKDLSAEEAVQELAKLVAWNNQNGGQAVSAPQAKSGGRPTIPSVSGKASSPVAPQVKSIEDLQRLAKEAGRMSQNY